MKHYLIFPDLSYVHTTLNNPKTGNPPIDESLPLAKYIKHNINPSTTNERNLYLITTSLDSSINFLQNTIVNAVQESFLMPGQCYDDIIFSNKSIIPVFEVALDIDMPQYLQEGYYKINPENISIEVKNIYLFKNNLVQPELLALNQTGAAIEINCLYLRLSLETIKIKNNDVRASILQLLDEVGTILYPNSWGYELFDLQFRLEIQIEMLKAYNLNPTPSFLHSEQFQRFRQFAGEGARGAPSISMMRLSYLLITIAGVIILVQGSIPMAAVVATAGGLSFFYGSRTTGEVAAINHVISTIENRTLS